MLLLLSPLLALVALLVKLDSKGPIFFAQERVGMNKRSFKLLKFRSMVVNAEELKAKLVDQNEVDGPVFKIKKDPRITRIGRFIRRPASTSFPSFGTPLSVTYLLSVPAPRFSAKSSNTNGSSANAFPSSPASPAFGKSADGTTSASTNGWNSTNNTSTTGPSGSISKFSSKRSPRCSSAAEPAEALHRSPQPAIRKKYRSSQHSFVSRA